MDPTELEALVDRELHQLPRPAAPRTLLPAVLAAAEQWSARPWYSRAWMTWPRAWQVASAAGAVASLLGAAAALAWLQAATGVGAAGTAVASTTTETIGQLSALVQAMETGANAARLVWLALVQPVVVYAFGFVVVMFSACVLLGIAINRVLFGKVFQS